MTVLMAGMRWLALFCRRPPRAGASVLACAGVRWRALTLAMARVVVLACRQRALACALQPRAVAARRCEVLLLRVHSGEGQLTSCRDASCRLA